MIEKVYKKVTFLNLKFISRMHKLFSIQFQTALVLVASLNSFLVAMSFQNWWILWKMDTYAFEKIDNKSWKVERMVVQNSTREKISDSLKFDYNWKIRPIYSQYELVNPQMWESHNSTLLQSLHGNRNSHS